MKSCSGHGVFKKSSRPMHVSGKVLRNKSFHLCQCCWRYCPANSKRGQYQAQIIRPRKLEARPFFFLNFKGTPSQQEHKIIFSGLKIIKMALSGFIDATALFPTVRYSLCDTDIDFPQSVNSGKSIFFLLKYGSLRPSYRAKAIAFS